MRRALITGITGQDGSYLTDLLLDKGYEVHGLIRSSSESNLRRIQHRLDDPRLQLHTGDLSGDAPLDDLVRLVAPDEVYNLGAQSNIQTSFKHPDATATTNTAGALRLLEAVGSTMRNCRLFQASSSEMFAATEPPQSETTDMQPRSPYGVSKLQVHRAVGDHRERHGMFAVSGILFNHESPRRGTEFVTRKITRAVAAIKTGLADHVELGNLAAVRDWGYAPEYVEAMWRSLQADQPDDYVLATGEGHTVQGFCEAAFAHAGLNWTEHVRHNSEFDRPTEARALIGDPSKAERLLGWRALTHAPGLARLMVDADLATVTFEHDPSVSRC